MINKYKVGVVIPVYKVKKEYLDICFQSIASQTYENLQIILVDDCSPDNCGIYCEEYAQSDSRVGVYHHEKNMGVSAARNTGFMNLDDDCMWVTFVDSDDWLDQNTIELIMNRLDKMNNFPDAVFFPACRDYPNRENLPELTTRNWNGSKELNELSIMALSVPLRNCQSRVTAIDSACAKIISVPFMKKNQILFRDLSYREDGMFFQELTAFANYIVEFPVGMYHYRETNGSMVNSFRKNAPQEQKEYLDMLYSFFERYRKDDVFFQAFYACCLISMQIVITQFFYHSDNTMSKRKARFECTKYFNQFPYDQVFSHISLISLKKNYFIKAICIKFHAYGMLKILRMIYRVKNNQICFD